MDGYWQKVLEKASNPWAIVGFVGQAIFAVRFVIQWIASERAKRVVVPEIFWHISLVGGLITLVYACSQADPVFMLAQTMGNLIYVRNLVLVRRHRAAGG